MSVLVRSRARYDAGTLRMAWVNRSMFSAVVLGVAVLVCAPPALAQSADELARARTLYRQGLSFEAAGDWSSALAKFEEVARVKLTPQVRYHIARSKEHLGRLNEALGDYRLAEYEAQQAGAKELVEITRAREELEAKIPKLVITRGKGAESARVELDGVELGEARVGKEVNVDPGPHRIVAKLSRGSFEETVNLAEGETKSVELLPPEELSAGGDAPAATSGVVADAAPQRVETGSSALPWIIGGVGAASLVASGVFFVLRSRAESDLEEGCRGDVCPERLRDTEDKGKLYTTLANVTLGVGAVGIGVAAVLLLSGGSAGPDAEQARKPRAPRLDFAASRGFTGVELVGSF